MKPGTEEIVELAIDSIQFGAPSSAGSTDSDGVPALLETVSDNKLPAPKEQRQKQPRAGPIKSQKVNEPSVTKSFLTSCITLKMLFNQVSPVEVLQPPFQCNSGQNSKTKIICT